MSLQVRSSWAGTPVMVGLSHRSAPLEVREQLSIEPDTWYAGPGQGMPSLLLVTCNRVEAYTWVQGRPSAAVRTLLSRLARAAGLSPTELRPHVVARHGSAAILHLVRVAAGLDSLVVGEEQIRGQVRDAYRRAAMTAGWSATLDGLVSRALEAGRRVAAATPMGHHPSVASAAVDAALNLPALVSAGTRREALVIGSGSMAKAAAYALVGHGAHVTITNRTVQSAERLATSLGARASVASLVDLPDLLESAWMVVSATASRRPMIDQSLARAAVSARAGRPLVVLDLSVPRNTDPAVRELAGVHLIDMAELEQMCPVDQPARSAEQERAEELAKQQAQLIERWLRIRALSPAISDLRERAEDIRRRELLRASTRLRGLSPDQQAVVEMVTSSIVKKLLHGPTVALRESAAAPRTSRRPRRDVLDVLRLDEPTRQMDN